MIEISKNIKNDDMFFKNIYFANKYLERSVRNVIIIWAIVCE
jgi:hypothetical protein